MLGLRVLPFTRILDAVHIIGTGRWSPAPSDRWADAAGSWTG